MKLSGSQLFKKFSAFYGTRRFITAFTSTRQFSLSYAKSIQSMPAHSTSWRFILICGNKMPTRCNRGFYCRSYCLLNVFRAPLCPSSGAQEHYTVVASCGISCCGFQVAGLVWSWGLCVRFAGCWFTSILKTTARNTTESNHYIILLSSWWWA